MTGALRLARRMGMRDWRAGDLRVVDVAVIVAISCLTSVGAFTDRVERAIGRQGASLIAADLVVRSPFEIDPAWRMRADALGLDSARSMSFRSVVGAGERAQLAEVKSVASPYPLRGTLRVAAGIGEPGEVSAAVPAAGTVWADPQLAASLAVEVGDELQVGRARLRLGAVLVSEPDRGFGAFLIAPRLMMNDADLAATDLVQEGSRVSHRLMLAGSPEEIEAFRAWVEPRLGTRASLLDPRNASPRLRLALSRAERFLGLATLASLLLAGIGVARGARHYVQRHLDTAALLRCIGASRRVVAASYCLQLVALAVTAGTIGAALGYLGQYVLAFMLPGALGDSLPPPSPWPGVTGVVMAVVALTGFAMPAVIRLGEVAPIRVLQRQLGGVPPRLAALYGAAALTLAALIVWTARDLALAAWVIGGTVLTVGFLGGVSYLALKALGRTRGRVSLVWRQGIAGLAKRLESTISQSVSFGVGVMAILLLTFVRADLLEAWDQRLPENTPNRFLINIQLSQLDELGAFMDGRGLDHGRFMPMARARLESINGRAVSPEQFEDPFARRMVMRAANLAWADELGPDNRIVQGRWWSEAEHGSPHLSVEADYAAHLGIGLGDTLTYQVGGRTVAFEVTSLRKVSWDSFRPNFFLLTTPGVLDPGASTYITSLHVPPDDLAFRPELVSRFPNVTDINVAELLGRVRDVLDRLSMAMEFIFLFTVAAGIVVLLAAIVTSREERRREVAVLRTFGASRRQLRRMFTAEFAILGALAGVIGCLASAVTGWAVARWLLELELRLSPSLWLAGVGGSVVVITVAGLIAMWSLMRTPPWRSIQLGA